MINKWLGKLPPNWGEKERWTRQRIHEIREAVQDKGDDRHKVKTLEDIGFDFEEWKKERETPVDCRRLGYTISNNWLTGWLANPTTVWKAFNTVARGIGITN